LEQEKNIWNSYKETIFQNFGELPAKESGIGYWRDYLFMVTLVYIMPMSLLALIPGVYVAINVGHYGIAFFDIFAVLSLLAISFSSSLSIVVKKILFVFTIYGIAVVLLISLGSYGPALMYLLAVSVFMIIIFPYKYRYLSVGLNVLFCFTYGLVLHYNFIEVHESDFSEALSWFAISANLLFINGVLAVLIPKLFGGMQQTIDEQLELKKALHKKQIDLEISLQQLRMKNEELEQFAYVASHDLQEPLRMVTSFLTLLEKKYEAKLDDKAKQYIFFAVDGARRMRQIILDLLEFSRVGKHNGNRQEVSLTELIEDVQKLHKSCIEERKAKIKTIELPIVLSHHMPLQVVFQNLIGNALKYSKPDIPPEITITAKIIDSGWQISVRDNGIGIEDAYFDRIFVIFKRLHDSKHSEGTGMGLAIAKKTIESMAGHIWVESHGNEGTTFHFTIVKA
jgi:signal transduction histidine kinase